MTRKSRQSYVDQAVGLLVQHYGVSRVQTALAKLPNSAGIVYERHPRRTSSKRITPTSPTVASLLEQLREKEGERHRLLSDFYTKLKDRSVLPESQDIRYFIQLIGLKEIGGKSRKDMIPKLMRFLLELPTERLQVDIENAARISEQHRQKAYSVLTDKLIGERPEKAP